MKGICDRAIAYLKGPASDRDLALMLSEQESPAMKVLGGELICTYVIDEGNRFEYVQNKILALEGVTIEALHESAVTNLENLARTSMQVQAYGPIYVVLMGGRIRRWSKTLIIRITLCFELHIYNFICCFLAEFQFQQPFDQAIGHETLQLPSFF